MKMKTQLNKKDFKKLGLNKNILEISNNMGNDSLEKNFLKRLGRRLYIAKKLKPHIKNKSDVIFNFIGIDDVIKGRPLRILWFHQRVDIFVKSAYNDNTLIEIPLRSVNFISAKKGLK